MGCSTTREKLESRMLVLKLTNLFLSGIRIFLGMFDKIEKKFLGIYINIYYKHFLYLNFKNNLILM